MKERFLSDDLRLNDENWKKLASAQEIVEEYAGQGLRLTLRQLYYQLVARGFIPNSDKEYAKLSVLLVKGRMAGEVDWDAIEDRIRVPYLPYYSEDISDALTSLASYYRINRQDGQKTHLEVWCEKDALSAVLKTITSHYHIYLQVNRGYSSCTAMYDAAKRFEQAESNAQDCKVLYIGDHDPSGLDMLRDIRDRLEEFRQEVEVIPIALTWEQVQEYNPPPNPAKISDPRAKWYIAEFGETSWEVDALRPEVLRDLVTEEIKRHLDGMRFQRMLAREDNEKARLLKIAKRESKKGEK